MKQIYVTCAIIERNGRVLAAQRSESMSMPLKWEFPGGKIEPGETPEECLKRELREELGVAVSIGRSLRRVTHRYPDFAVVLYPYLCAIFSGDIVPHQHSAVAWLRPEELRRLDWAEADRPIFEEYLQISEANKRGGL